MLLERCERAGDAERGKTGVGDAIRGEVGLGDGIRGDGARGDPSLGEAALGDAWIVGVGILTGGANPSPGV